MTLLLLTLLLSLISENIFGNFHPQFLTNLLVLRFICILLGHLHILTLQGYFDSLIKMIENCINNYLSLFHHRHLCL